MILITVIPFDGDPSNGNLTPNKNPVGLTTYVKTAEGVDVLAGLGLSISFIANR